MSCHIWTMEILYWSISPSQVFISLFNLYKIMLLSWCVKSRNMTAQLSAFTNFIGYLSITDASMNLRPLCIKHLDEQELQYLFDKPSFKTSKLTTRQSSSNSKQLVVPFNRERTQGDRGFSFTGQSYWII